jgi:3alpha(or 20beta)-hydroxysteroid dehydrogenase
MTTNSESLAGKVIVVTGAIAGLGAAMTRALVRDGATVLGAVRDDDPARRQDLQDAPGTIEYRRVDVTSPDDWAEFGAWISTRFEGVDGLVNNAGATLRARLEEVELEGWNRMIAVNATGPLLGIQQLVPMMSRGGSIVNIASIAALTAHWPAAYTASKWALRGLSLVAASELAPRGIRVNTVFPGFIDTPMTASSPPAQIEAFIGSTPMGRPGTEDEVASLVRFLVSDESSYISGAEIPVDGGYTGHRGAKLVSDTMLKLSLAG